MRLVAGASGVLGSGFCEVLRARGEPYERLVLPWDEPSAVAERVVEQWQAARQARPDEPITLIWAAGTGGVAAPAEAMAAETETLRRVVRAVGERVEVVAGDAVLFASSAGAVFGGHRGGVITDATPPAPITPYGREKLEQERIVAELGIKTLSCRFTNVFGLADGRLRRRGLVAALVHAAMLRQPARIFVSPDTRRDYLYNLDAARLALAELDAVPPGSTPRMRIVRTGSTMTVLDLVGSIARVLRRRVPVVITESPESRSQPLMLSFQPRSGVQGGVPTTSFAAAVRAMAEARRDAASPIG
jgi:UDP-glucose 4-epimerase